MPLPLQLPTIQNWSCHSCSRCCRQHAIEITEEEKQRIEGQKWTPADGVPAGRPLLVWFGGPRWRKRYRLGHQADGACVFLDDKGLCRIHAKFGEAAKPLSCRVYPFAFHPSGKRLTVSLRFSCPSVVANDGKPVASRRDELKEYQRALVPEGVEKIPAPAIAKQSELDWPDFLRFVDALDETLKPAGVSMAAKLMQSLFWLKLVSQARFDKVRGARLGEFLDLIRDEAGTQIPRVPDEMPEPGRTGRTQFRMLVAQYARKDTPVSMESGLAGRWKLFRAAVRFARGKGDVPPLQDVFKAVPFAAIEQPFGGVNAECEEIFTRYFRVKVQGLHFCGRAYYGLPLVEGFQSLALIYPSILWLARWLAAGEGRTTLSTDDVSRGMSIADHYHAYSPAFGRATFRRRVRILASLGDIERLGAWYSR